MIENWYVLLSCTSPLTSNVMSVGSSAGNRSNTWAVKLASTPPLNDAKVTVNLHAATMGMGGKPGSVAKVTSPSTSPAAMSGKEEAAPSGSSVLMVLWFPNIRISL